MAEDIKKKLELYWVGKNNPEYDISNIEPRILEENPELSNCFNDPDTDNMIIHGDNLLALKALLPEYEGMVKCIYIDPPYNIDAAGVPYDDNVEHSLWLSLMRPRLVLLFQLLHEDGLFAVQIDDNEYAKLYLLLAEVFGGEKNLKTIVVKMSEATGVKMASTKKAGSIPKLKEYIIIAKKNGVKGLKLENIPKEKWDNEYKIYLDNVSLDEINFVKEVMINEDRTEADIEKADLICNKFVYLSVGDVFNGDMKDLEKWRYENAWRIVRTVATTDSAKKIADTKRQTTNCKSFLIVTPKKKSYLIKADYNLEALQPRIKLLFADQYLTVALGDLWVDIKTTGLDNEGGVEFKNGKKPEALLKRIIGMSSESNDIVLDSFLGSGSTAAVAQKMSRRYIGIEMGEHAYTHCKVRLDKVIDGTDQGGISDTIGWTGGGAYKFYELAPSFIVKDEHGNNIIDGYYNETKLIKAMCKLLNFTYQPSKTEYWKHGVGQGKNYIFITTQLLTCGMVQQIVSHLAEGESLIISPKKYEPGAESIDSRITIKKIPQSVLKACHFGKKEYLLPIKETALEEAEINEENE